MIHTLFLSPIFLHSATELEDEICLEIWQGMLARDGAWPKTMGAELEV